MAPPVFKTGLAGIAFAGGFDSLPPPPKHERAPAESHAPAKAWRLRERWSETFIATNEPLANTCAWYAHEQT